MYHHWLIFFFLFSIFLYATVVETILYRYNWWGKRWILFLNLEQYKHFTKPILIMVPQNQNFIVKYCSHDFIRFFFFRFQAFTDLILWNTCGYRFVWFVEFKPRFLFNVFILWVSSFMLKEKQLLPSLATLCWQNVEFMVDVNTDCTIWVHIVRNCKINHVWLLFVLIIWDVSVYLG